MSMYRGYQITKTSNGQYIFYGTSINAFFKTKEEAIIDARRVISFRASKELKKRVNS